MNYVELQTAVANFLNRSDLYASIPTFIVLTEAHMSRRLRVRPMIAIAQDAAVASEFQTLPGDFAGPLSVTLSTGETLDNLAPDAMNAKKFLNSEETRTPDSYAIVGTQIQFNPVPSAVLTCVLSYWANIPALSVSNTSNWLLAAHPDAYLYGALVEAGLYLTGDRRVGIWTQRFSQALDEIEAADRLESYGARLTPHTSLVV